VSGGGETVLVMTPEEGIELGDERGGTFGRAERRRAPDDGSRGLSERRSTAREAEADRREDRGGQVPNANDKSMRGGWLVNPCHHPDEETTRINPRGPRSRWLCQTNMARGRRDRNSEAHRNAKGKADAD